MLASTSAFSGSAQHGQTGNFDFGSNKADSGFGQNVVPFAAFNSGGFGSNAGGSSTIVAPNVAEQTARDVQNANATSLPHTPSAPATGVQLALLAREDRVRTMFACDRNNAELNDPHIMLMDVFNNASSVRVYSIMRLVCFSISMCVL